MRTGLVALGAVLALAVLAPGCDSKPQAPPASAPSATPAPTAPTAAQPVVAPPPAAPVPKAPPPLLSMPQQSTAPRQVLYNGLALNPPWPPRYVTLSPEGMPVPYLRESPAVIPVDVGRQLFVDDFIIESATNFKRTFHQAELYPENPVLRPDKPWESEGGRPTAMVSHGGVWYDQQDRLFKMWYTAGDGAAQTTCLAVSTNGTNWEKPLLELNKNSNVVLPGRRQNETVWLNAFETDPAKRFRLFRQDDSKRLSIYQSSDGINWGSPLAQSGICGEDSTVFYNPVRQMWGFSIGTEFGNARARKYFETKDVLAGASWTDVGPLWWTGADRNDFLGVEATGHMYCLDVIPYECLFVGLFTMGDGMPPGKGRPAKIELGFSRDGFHWFRPDRRPFIPVAQKPEDWYWNDLRSAGGGMVMIGRRLNFYFAGRSANGVGGTGFATLRRDGFASMDAETDGVLTTWPVRFTGKYLFANLNNTNGSELRIDIVDQNNKVIEPFTKEKSMPMVYDTTLVLANWEGVKDLSSITNKPVKFRFYMNKGSLYSFWVSPSVSGASRGFIGAGGPHYNQPVDTIGNSSYRALPVLTNYLPQAKSSQ